MRLAAAQAQRLRLALYIATGLCVGAVAAVVLLPGVRERLLPPLKVASIGRALVGGPFSLINHKGQRVTDKDYRGKLLVVMFGFTFCPDVCPTELQLIAAALDKLGARADEIQPLFISIDPERDTPERLATYVKSFDPRIIGLTGQPSEIDAAAKAYRVYVKKVPDPKSTAGYTVDHSALIYLMDRNGEYRAHVTPGISADALADRLDKLLRS
jgi:protein SCO1/2